MEKSLAALVKLARNLIAVQETGLTTKSRMQLPDLFIALVKQSGEDEAVLSWKGKVFQARIEVPVREGEKLLLELTKQENGVKHYRMAARSPEFEYEGAQANQWHLFYRLDDRSSPYLVQLFYHRRRAKKSEKAGAAEATWEMKVYTLHFGQVYVQLSGCDNTYCCRLIVEKKEYGELLQAGLAELFKQPSLQVLRLLPFQVSCRSGDETQYSSLILNQKV